jgi:phage terminase large subunit-like protein
LELSGAKRERSVWLGWAHAFISPEGWESRKANHAQYEDFIKDGDLTLVERLPDDVTAVVDIVKQCFDSGKLAQGRRRPGGPRIDRRCSREDRRDAGKRIAWRCSPGRRADGRVKTVERKLADGSFKHGGRAMMAWCAGNAIVQATGTGHAHRARRFWLREGRSAHGGFDAVAEMSLNPTPVHGPSIYETRPC